MIRSLAAVCVIWGSTAQAMLPPCANDQMIAGATDVVQIVEPVVSGPDARGMCDLRGVIARSFRGSLVVRDKLALTLACANVDGLVGAQMYRDPDAMRNAVAIELHLQSGGVAGYGAGLFVLAALTETVQWQTECGPEDSWAAATASSAAMSNLTMEIIACITRPEGALASSRGRESGRICQDRPQRSVSQPQGLSVPPSCSSALQSRSISA